MKRYRLYTEDINEAQTKRLFTKYLESYTVYKVIGAWHGAPEHSIVLEVIGGESNNLIGKFRLVAQQIKKLNKQEAVLITSEDIKMEEI